MTYYDNHGEKIRLGREIGKGGEGTVYELEGNANYVAKIYLCQISEEKQKKLELMANMASPELTQISAWPVKTIRKSNETVGFIMPKMHQYKELYHLYIPKDREHYFPHANWKYLLVAGMNLSIALETLHKKNIVVGDVSGSNICVSRQATIYFIDCDSFQISNNGQTFPCEVGTPEFTPPELHGIDLKTIHRSTNHDSFGLAILVFYLLFQTHPFQGSGPNNVTEPTEAIRRGLYAHSMHQSVYSPPKTAPKPGYASKEIVDLFENAFNINRGGGKTRPTPAQWYNGLKNIIDNLTTCSDYTSHLYFKPLNFCPWCLIIENYNFDYFNALTSSLDINQQSVFDINYYKNLCSTISFKPFGIHINKNIVINEKKDIDWVNDLAQRKTIYLSVVIMCLAIVIFTAYTPFLLPIPLMLLLGATAWYLIENRNATVMHKNEIESKERQYTQAKTDYFNLAKRLGNINNYCASKYESIKIELNNLIAKYENIKKEECAEKENMSKNRSIFLFQKWMESHLIDDAQLYQIGRNRKATLATCGLISALDIEKNEHLLYHLKGQGFGDVLISTIIAWKNSVKNSFNSYHNDSISQQDYKSIEMKYRVIRKKLEKSIVTTEKKIMTVKKESKSEYEKLENIAQQLYVQYLLAKENRIIPQTSVSKYLSYGVYIMSGIAFIMWLYTLIIK